jgi:hypothetical protein
MCPTQLFIEFRKAYNSIKREVLQNIFIEFGVQTKLVRPIKMCLYETYSKDHVCIHLSDNFPMQKGSKQVDDLLPLLFNFALEYTIIKAQKMQVGLKLSETHQFLAYAMM